VPTFGWRVVDEWTDSPWLYARSFAALEAQLSQGARKVDDKAQRSTGQLVSLNCRWRLWIRQRDSAMPFKPPNEPREVIAGWLGCKHRRGTWKSRFHILMTATAGQLMSPDNEEDDSSHDEEEPDEDDLQTTPTPGSASRSLPIISSAQKLGWAAGAAAAANNASVETKPAALASSLGGNGVPPGLLSAAAGAAAGAAAAEETWTVLVYFRRGFEDMRASFQSGFEVSDILKLPRKYVKTVTLPSRCRVEVSKDHFARFYLKFPSGKQRTFNAAAPEQRDRWMEALVSIFGDGSEEKHKRSSSNLLGPMVADMYQIAKRGQVELRRGLMPWRRRSSLPPPSLTAMSGSAPQFLPSLAVTSLPSTYVTELVRDPASGSLGITLSEHTNGGGSAALAPHLTRAKAFTSTPCPRPWRALPARRR
jgi:hypothetical protein